MATPKPKEYTPRKLSPQEIKDPNLALFHFFDYSSLPRIREHLWEWLKTTVSGTYNTKLLDKNTRYDIIHLYEHIEKLIEAAWLIHTKQKTTKKKKRQNKQHQR